MFDGMPHTGHRNESFISAEAKKSKKVRVRFLHAHPKRNDSAAARSVMPEQRQ
jgi:hypothetical protein